MAIDTHDEAAAREVLAAAEANFSPATQGCARTSASTLAHKRSYVSCCGVLLGDRALAVHRSAAEQRVAAVLDHRDWNLCAGLDSGLYGSP